MSFHGRVSGTKVKRALGVQAALEWAFRVEQAQLELPLPPDVTEEGFGFGLEYVLLQRAVLGCKIDGGQHKIGGYTHEDAEVIAATVAGIPDSLGGKRMAIRVAELARAGLTPDWMPGAVPRCVPTIVKQNQHGTHAGAIVVGVERIRVRGPGARATWKTIDILACPVTFSPHPHQIEAARRGYDDWWQALPSLGIGERTGQHAAHGRLHGLDQDVLPLEARQIDVAVEIFPQILQRQCGLSFQMYFWRSRSRRDGPNSVSRPSSATSFLLARASSPSCAGILPDTHSQSAWALSWAG
jgi:hypothetical protein